MKGFILLAEDLRVLRRDSITGPIRTDSKLRHYFNCHHSGAESEPLVLNSIEDAEKIAEAYCGAECRGIRRASVFSYCSSFKAQVIVARDA